MAKIKYTSKCAIYDGMTITLRAPCDCSEVDGLNVYHQDEVQAYTFRDANGNDLTGVDSLFSEGAYIKAALDSTNGHAYLLNMAASVTYTVSVSKSWKTYSSGGYYQTIAVPGILESDNPIADVVLGTNVDTNGAYLNAWAAITRITTADGSITLYANQTSPQSAFTMQLKVVR